MGLAVEYPTMATLGAGILRIGFDNPFRPLAWSVDERPEGPLIEMAARVLEAARFKATFVPLALQHSLGALAAGDVDILAFKAVVPDREAEMLFTTPLMITGAALFRPASTVEPLGSEYSPRIVATPAKGPLVNLLAKRFPEARPLLTEDYPKALEAVIAGEADAAALNVHVGWHWAEALYPKRFARPQQVIEKLPLAMVVGKRSGAALRNRLDACIRKLVASGELREILERSGVPLLD
jgi:polar amino acid transport system substrate-binding protein